MKVAYLAGVNSTLDVSRGIGAHTNALNEQLVRLEGKDFKIVDDSRNADITHITKFHPFFISLPFKKTSRKVILTIHDLIPLIYPYNYPPGLKGKIRFLINKYLIKKNIDQIITISETSKKDICRFLDVEPKKVSVVYIAPKKSIKKLKPGVWENELRERYNLPKQFILFDHGVNYNKNIPALIKACRKIKVQLAIVGKETESIGNLDLNHPELAHLKGVDFSDVIKLGYVSDDDLNKLFNLATCYVQPSFYEGFGMPVLEAMVAECPVIAAKTQALVEVGEGACLFADPKNSDDIAEKILEVVNSKALREELTKAGKELVKKFSWEKTAKETLEVYKHV